MPLNHENRNNSNRGTTVPHRALRSNLRSPSLSRAMNNTTISPPLCGEELLQLSSLNNSKPTIVRVLDYNLSSVRLRFGYKRFAEVPLATFWQRYARTTN